jgi:hypothetical protein
MRIKNNESLNMNIITLNINGIPDSLLGGGGGGDHFHGCPRRNRTNEKD